MPFDEVQAELAVRFYQRLLTHTKGAFAKKAFQLLDWELQILWDVFGTLKSNGLRQYSTVYCEIPKKNGKTEFAAGIALFGLIMDNEPAAEVYIAAASRDQASICFRVAAQMVRNSPRLNSMCSIYPGTKTIVLKSDPNSFLKAISADAGTQDGINPHIAVFDELHRQKNTDLWDVLKYGQATRTQPLMFAITTAGIIGESPICEQQHDYADNVRKGVFKDPSYYPIIYGLDEKEDWTLEGEPAERDESGEIIKPATGWWKANPSMGYHLYLDKIREEYQQASNNPSQQNAFRRLRLNQWVGQEERYIPLEDWRKNGEPFNPEMLVGKRCIAGLDLSATEDITAFVMLFNIEGIIYWLPHFWIPEHQIQKRSRKDKVPYDVWIAQGYVTATPGNQVDHKFVKAHILKLAKIYDMRELAYDRWMAIQMISDLKDEGINVTPIGQGYASMSAPTKEMLRLILAIQMRHNGNPVLEWMANCFSVQRDPADNVKPSKPNRNRSSKRIDGIAAGLNALARMILSSDYKKSVYEDRGVRSIG